MESEPATRILHWTDLSLLHVESIPTINTLINKIAKK